MSGKVMGATPWMRRAVVEFEFNHPDTLAAIEAEIPDGHHITLICRGKPRPLGAVLMGPIGRQVDRIDPAYSTVGGACYALLAKVREVVA